MKFQSIIVCTRFHWLYPKNVIVAFKGTDNSKFCHCLFAFMLFFNFYNWVSSVMHERKHSKTLNKNKIICSWNSKKVSKSTSDFQKNTTHVCAVSLKLITMYSVVWTVEGDIVSFSPVLLKFCSVSKYAFGITSTLRLICQTNCIIVFQELF